MWCHINNSLNPESITKSSLSNKSSTKLTIQTATMVNTAYIIKPLNLQGGQCNWCGKYGHKRIVCPLLK